MKEVKEMTNEFKKDEVLGKLSLKNYEVELLPFGVNFREPATIVEDSNATGTSASVTVTLPLDSDTDPPDSD